MNKQCPYCDQILKSFKQNQPFSNKIMKIPERPGAYVVVVRKRGRAIGKINEGCKRLVAAFAKWPIVQDVLKNEIGRLDKIGMSSCPIVYVGGAGVQQKGKNTLQGRYKHLTGGHVAQVPLWILTYFGWEFELRWRVAKSQEGANKSEAVCLERYKKFHGSQPAFNRQMSRARTCKGRVGLASA